MSQISTSMLEMKIGLGGFFKLPIKSVLNILLNVTGVHQKYSIITCLCALKQNVPKNSSMLSNFLC